MQVMIIPFTPFQQNSTLMWCPETMKDAIARDTTPDM